MIKTLAYDIEILPNFFSITFIDVNDYRKKFEDCVNDKGKSIPLVQKLSVAEIKERLSTVETHIFYFTDTDDSQLLSLYKFIIEMGSPRSKYKRYDLFGYNSKKFDKIIMAGFLSFYKHANDSKTLIKKLYELSKTIINNQNDPFSLYKNPLTKNLINYKLPFIDIDVMAVFALNKVGSGIDDNGNKVFFGKGLKQTSINLQWWQLLDYEMPPISDKDIHLYHKHNEYKGVPAERLNKLISVWDRYIIPEWINEMLHYNTNDVFIVCEIIRLNINEVKSRYSISNSYNVNVLNSSRSNIADVLFEKFYSEFSGLEPSQWKGGYTERTKMAFKRVIFPHIKFKTKELQDLLTDMKSVVITSLGKDSFKREVKINKLSYTLATGGIHSKDIPSELRSKLISPSTGLQMSAVDDPNNVWDYITDDSYVYTHWDIASFYPYIMAMYDVAPKHLNQKAFVKLIRWLAESRIEAKHTKEKTVNGIDKDVFVLVLKIVINSIYGKLGFEKGNLCDRLAVLKVTINGQLMILQLCEELELNGIQVVSANTDGIVVKLYKRDKAKFEKLAEVWKAENKLMADSEEFECYINRDINNYFIKELNGKMSYKGVLNPEMYLTDLSKGYNMPIVAKALVNFFIDNIPIMDTLTDETNILNFCKTQNIGKKFVVVSTDTSGKETIVQRNVRYYVSNSGSYLAKQDTLSSYRVSLETKTKCTILNTMDDEDIALKDVNYRYYYNECMKIINTIKLGVPLNLKAKGGKDGTKSGRALTKKYYGCWNTLFDDLEE